MKNKLLNLNWHFTVDGARNGLRTVAPVFSRVCHTWYYHYTARRWTWK